MDFKLITDTLAGLPIDIVNKYNIRVIPLSYINKDQIFTPTGNESEEYYKTFYNLLRNNENLSTSCINTELFIEEFTKILEEGKDVLYLGFSSGLSNTYFCSTQARDILKEKYPNRKILCVDTLLASLGQGLLVYTICQEMQKGKTIDELYNMAISLQQNINSLFTVNTLYYLAKGGRVSKLTSTIGNLVDIKPLMYVSEQGKLLVYNKVIGRKRSIFALADKVVNSITNPQSQEIFISHGDAIEDAKLLEKLISDKIKVKGFVYNYVDPVIGVHSGPGTLAVFYFGSNREKTVHA